MTPVTAPAAPTRVDLLVALDEVHDPELHEPVTTLGFVASAEVDRDGLAEVHLRLPTFFCSPNFAWLMVADAHDAVAAVPGVRVVRVVLDEHFAGDVINAGVAARAGFVDAFTGEAVAELDELRVSFLRKAVLAGTDVVARGLLASGRTAAQVHALTLGEVAPSADLDHLLARRRELGLPSELAAPLLVDVITGAPLAACDVPLHLRRARLTQVGVEANTSICRGMLAHRYDDEGAVR